MKVPLDDYVQKLLPGSYTPNIEDLVKKYLYKEIDETKFKELINDELNLKKKPWTVKEASKLRACSAEYKMYKDEKVDNYFSEEVDVQRIYHSACLSSYYGFANCAGAAHLACIIAFSMVDNYAIVRLWYFGDERHIHEELNFISVSLDDDKHIIIIPWLNEYFFLSSQNELLNIAIARHFTEKDKVYDQMTLVCIFSSVKNKQPEYVLQGLDRVLNSELRETIHREIEQDYSNFIREHGVDCLKKSPYSPYNMFALYPIGKVAQSSSTSASSLPTRLIK